MAKITFIILAHENADHVADLANLLTEWDPHANAVIHYDLNAPAKQFERLKGRVADSKKIFLVKDRLKCGWGNFSLVDAVVRALRVIRREKLNPDRVMLISGACMPLRPLR
jgi:flavorubredoxin